MNTHTKIEQAIAELQAETGDRETWHDQGNRIAAEAGDYTLEPLSDGWHVVSYGRCRVSKGPFASAVKAYHAGRVSGGWLARPENWPDEQAAVAQPQTR